MNPTSFSWRTILVSPRIPHCSLNSETTGFYFPPSSYHVNGLKLEQEEVLIFFRLVFTSWAVPVFKNSLNRYPIDHMFLMPRPPPDAI